jgi:hypothetical protein
MNDSFFGRLGDAITNPGRLMENVGKRPVWWQPGLLIFVAMIVSTYLTLPIAAPEQAELMRDSWLMNLAGEEAAEQAYEDARDVSPAKLVLNSFSSGFIYWIGTLLFGLALGFFARLAGGEGTFSQALGIVSWGAMPVFLFGTLIKVPLVLITESVFEVNVGLVTLVPGLQPGEPLFSFLMIYGDFFAWWGLFLVVVGFQKVFGMARSAAIPSVVLPWALFSTIPLVFSLISLSAS